jgi:hypothetical protein
LLFQMPNKMTSSQKQIDIREVKNGILVLRGNRYRAVLQSSALNFELKSEEERDALIDSYQSFLNSLSCPVQILVRTREIDMDKYLENLSLQLADEEEDTYKSQLGHYSNFVRQLVTSNKILTRQFYVVVPCDAKDGAQPELAIDQLSLSCEIISRGLSRMGMRVRKLSSVEVLDLFYSYYSPDQAKMQPLSALTLRALSQSAI